MDSLPMRRRKTLTLKKTKEAAIAHPFIQNAGTEQNKIAITSPFIPFRSTSTTHTHASTTNNYIERIHLSTITLHTFFRSLIEKLYYYLHTF